ncbi:seminal metalloprotease 1-like [Procambarus clarkii]|uniref:seminal metalloprotease 1-like n=1 Tax=Procambarus clarkii TaxID=6728 RepID=UPI001E6783C3|nr:seminal metalloprotease 1-like [Procambarus clarkii]
MEFIKLLLVTWTCLWGAGPWGGSTHAHGDEVDLGVGSRHAQNLTMLTDISDVDRLKERRAMVSFLKVRWPNKVMPVGFDPMFSESYKATVYRSMDLLNNFTCLRFRNVTEPENEHYLHIFAGKACSAIRGFTRNKKKFQKMSLGRGCNVRGFVIHELLHAAGFHHQHVRADRNDYVTIHWNNIQKHAHMDFSQKDGEHDYLLTMGLPYDFNSIMHYSKNAFAIDNKHHPTIEIKKHFPGRLGQHKGLSRTDIAMLNRLYECWDHYLGDDIPDAVDYKEFNSRYFKEKTDQATPVSDEFKLWLHYMRSLHQ